MKMRLFIGDRQMRITQEFQTLGKILELAFGDSSKNEPQPKVVQTEDELMLWAAPFFR